jgi:phasin family protein
MLRRNISIGNSIKYRFSTPSFAARLEDIAARHKHSLGNPMSTLPEQFSAARKAQVESQLDYVRNFTSKFVESTEKVIALNLSTSRASIEKSTATLHQLISLKDPRDLITLTTQSQNTFERFLAYGSELVAIAASAQSELLRPITAATVAAAQRVAALPAPIKEVEVEVEVPTAAFAPVETAAEAAQAFAAPVQEAAQAVEDSVEQIAEQAAEEVSAQAEAAQELVVEAPAAAAAEVSAAAEEVLDEVVPVPVEEAKPSAISEAISELVAEPEAPVLAASPIVTDEAPQLKITGIEPVDAQPPHVQLQGKSDQPKSRRRK